jgi:hypothetical protein
LRFEPDGLTDTGTIDGIEESGLEIVVSVVRDDGLRLEVPTGILDDDAFGEGEVV